MMDISGCGYDEIVIRKLTGVKTDSRFVIEGGYCFPRAFDRTAKRLIREVSRVEEFSEEFVRRVLDHFHLFEDNLLLAFQVFLFETRV
jgi:hypothetical protein